jgi:hypothetical protein
MDTYVFRIRVQDTLDDDAADRLYEGLDGEVAVEDGPRGHFVGFEREGESFLDTVLDAIAELINLDFEPLAIEDELVSMADIAERVGRTRQSVSMLVSGQRGEGNFPLPVAGNVRSPLWHWADVAAWFEAHEGDEVVPEDRMRTIAAINGALACRVLARDRPKVVEEIERRIAG